MTLKEALESGRPFRWDINSQWLTQDSLKGCMFSVSEVLYENWELAPAPPTLKEKPKFKMWLWVIQDRRGNVELTGRFYSSQLEVEAHFRGYKILQCAQWSEIEVEATG